MSKRRRVDHFSLTPLMEMQQRCEMALQAKDKEVQYVKSLLHQFMAMIMEVKEDIKRLSKSTTLYDMKIRRKLKNNLNTIIQSYNDMQRNVV